MSEYYNLDIEQAKEIWHKRFQNNCKYRRSIYCKEKFNPSGNCDIRFCPYLPVHSGLEMHVEYTFRDIKK